MGRQQNRWIICAGCTLLLFCTVGLTTSAFSVYQPYLISIIKLSNTQASMVVTVRSFFSLLSIFLVQAYLRRMGLRLGVTLAALAAAVSFFLFGMASNFVGCFVAAAVSGLAYGLGGMVPVSIVINRVFQTRQGFALGICAAGTGAATIIIPPIATALIEGGSLRLSMWCEGILVILVAALVFFVLRDSEENRQEATRQAEPAKGAPPDEDDRVVAWLGMGTVLMLGTLAGPSFAHLSVLYASEKFDSVTVSWLMSFVGIALTVGKCVYGQVADRMGGRRSSYLFFGVLVLGQLLACFAGPGGMVTAIISMACLGMGLPLSTVGLSVLAADLVSPERFAVTVKNYQMVFMVGSLLFGAMPGIIADATGSYVPAYVVLCVLSAISMLFIYLAYGRKRAARQCTQ